MFDLQNRNGQPVPVKVIAKDEKTVTFDANHEMAGKELNFRIELVEAVPEHHFLLIMKLCNLPLAICGKRYIIIV